MPDLGSDIFKSYFETLPTLMGVLGFDGAFSEFNAAWEQQLGYPAAEMRGRPCLDLVFPEDRELVREHQQKLLNGEPQFLFEARFLCRDGQVKWLHLRCAADRDRRLIYMQASDISARKVVEESLRQSEITLRKIIDNAPMSMAIVGFDGKIEYINKKAEETFGFPHSDIPDMDAWWVKAYPDEAYRKEVVANWMGRVYKAIEANTEIPGDEFRVTCKDGTVKTCFIFGVIAAGKVFVMFNDISARVAVEKALRESETSLRLILDNAPMALGILLQDGRVEYLNRKFNQTFGFSQADIPTFSDWERMAAIDEAHRAESTARWHAAVSKAAETGGEIDAGEFRARCRGGEVKTFYIRAVMIAGKAIIMFDDITERVKAQQALRESEATLRRVIDQAPIAMGLHNMGGKVEYVNAKFTETFGYVLEEISDRESWAQKVAPDPGYRAELNARWSAAVKLAQAGNGQIHGEEYRLTCKDGSVKTIFVFGVISAGKAIVLFDDITERVKTQQALRDSEKTLRRVLEQAPVGIVVHDFSGKFEFINSKFINSFGYKPEDIPDLQTWTRKAYPEEGYRSKLSALWGEWIEKSTRTGQEMEGGEFRVVCKDGTVKTAFITGVVTPDKKVVSLVEDVTARVETEKALRESESLYRALVETTRTGYVVLDGRGKVLDANREYVRLSGHSDLKEIIGRSVLEWSAPHHQKEAQEAVDIVVREGRLSNFELDYVGKAGKLTTVEINATVVSRGGVQQILGLCRDVSARSRTEAQLRDSESLYRALVETTRTGYVVVDTSGKVLDANREYVRLTGHSDLREILGRSVTEWTAPDKMAENAAAVAQCARDGYIFNFETDYVDKAGNRTPIEINATVASRSGKPQIHTLCRDITQRRRTEAELRSLNQGLEQRVAERTSELTKANIELSQEVAHRMDAERSREKLQAELLQAQKMEVVGRLAGGIAHDFNNILVAISGYAEFLLKTLPEGAPAREDLGEIIRETERGAMLTRQLTAIGRKQPLEPKVLSVNAVVEDSCKMLKRLIGSNMNLELRLAEGTWNIKFDPGQVAQVVMNLVVNARDAMPEGGQIVISTANEEVASRPEGLRLPPKPGDYVTISVADTGCGMSDETAARIFEPFFTTKAEGKGTGLGLSTVYGIVQQAGGGIDLKTSPGKGSTFKIYFPRTAERP